MKKKYLNLLILLIGLCIVIIWINTKASEEKKVLKIGIFAGSYWDVPYGDCYKIIDTAIKNFESSHPGIKVEYINGILKDDYSEWISGEILRGTAPDVFMVLPEDFNVLASIGSLKSLDNMIAKDKEFDTKKYYNVSYNFGEYEGQQFALPYESVPTLMFVNKTLLEKENIDIPFNNWSWDEFYEICKKVTKDTDGDGQVDQFGCYDYTWGDAIYSNGISLFNEEGTESYFGDEKIHEAVEFIKNLDELNSGYKITYKDFDEGKVAFRPLLFSDYSTYKTYPWKIKKYSNFEWDCIMMPAGKSGANISQVSTLLLGINSKTNNEKLAWEFLKLLTYSEEIQENIFKYSQGVSVLKNVTELAQIKNKLGAKNFDDSYVNISLLSEVMESAVVSPRFRKYESVMAISDTVINQGISNNDNLSYLLLKLQRDINELLKN